MRLVKAKQAGIRFVQVDRAVNVRLHNFVWDRMVEPHSDDSAAVVLADSS